MYFIGVLYALISGIMTATGLILVKIGINRVHLKHQQSDPTPEEAREQKREFRPLLKSPLWLGGVIITGLAGIFFVLAELTIGPTLVPGLNAVYLIILAIGSVKLIGERLHKMEILGILALVVGIAILGISGLTVAPDAIETGNPSFILRLILYSGLLSILCCVLLVAALKPQHKHGLLLGLAAGAIYGVSDIWLFITIGTGTRVIEQTTINPVLDTVFFVVGVAILVGTNVIAFWALTKAYKLAPISRVQPLQEVPSQISPLFGFLFVFCQIASRLMLLLGIIGIVFIIIGGFLVANRTEIIKK
jgi:drug/metabolite transporter (DMT)-like permease